MAAPNKAPAADGVYVSRCAWLDQVDHVLVTFCSEPRYREAIVEFLGTKGIIRYDQAVLPGGPAIILQSSFTFINDRARIKLLLDEHQINRVIGIAHLNCAYYRHRYENVSPQDMREMQENDLRLFREEIGKLAPEVAVELYYAEGKSGHVHFTPIL
jgi:hypothetical protein